SAPSPPRPVPGGGARSGHRPVVAIRRPRPRAARPVGQHLRVRDRRDFRHVENPAGTESLRETRFPFVSVAGPIRKSPGVVGISFSSYTSRDFTQATSDTILLRDALVPVNDTLSSRGGLSDLRFAGAYRLQDTWIFGGSFHVITGTDRLRFRRSFSDSSYQAATQRSELS